MSVKNIIAKTRKLNYDFNPILYNRFVLYFFVFISLIEILFLMNTNDLPSLVIFIVVGLLISFFNKNMIVILCLALSITNLIKYGISGVRINEGFEDSKDSSKLTQDENIVIKNLGSTNDNQVPNNAKDSNDTKDNKDTKDEKNKDYNELKKDFPEFKKIQSEILSGISKIDPLLDKAESFIEKFEHFKNKEGLKNKK